MSMFDSVIVHTSLASGIRANEQTGVDCASDAQVYKYVPNNSIQSQSKTTVVTEMVSNDESTIDVFFNHVSENYLTEKLSTGQFWRYFSIIKSRADGHCLVYSAINSLRAQHKIYIEYQDILSKIRNEIYENRDRYKGFFRSVPSLLLKLNAYVDERKYNSRFCDAVPFVICNILSMSMVIIEKEGSSFKPNIINCSLNASNNCPYLYVFKNGDHYDGLNCNVFESPQNCAAKVNISPYIVGNTATCFTRNAPHVSLLSESLTDDHPTLASGSVSFEDTNQFTTREINNKPIIKPNICCWNIHGLNLHKLSDETCGPFLKQFDVIVLCETWSLGNIAEDILDGFVYKDVHRPYKHIKARRGAGGIGIFIKNTLTDGIELYRNNKDIIAWIKFSKKKFELTNDLLLGAVYCPPENSTSITDDAYAVIYEEIASLPVHFDKILCGDFNAHVSKHPDWVEHYNVLGSEGDWINMPQLTEELMGLDYSRTFTEYLSRSGCLHRTSQDTCQINNHGIELLTFCKTTNMFIVNGRTGQDRNVGSISYISDYKGQSLVDYVLACPKTFMLIENFRFCSKLPESDHIPMAFTLTCGLYQNTLKRSDDRTNWYSNIQYMWKDTDLNKLNMTLTDETSISFYNQYRDSVAEYEDSNVVASKFHDYFNQACKRTLKQKVNKPQKTSNRTKWFDQDCYKKRAQVIKAGKTAVSEDDLLLLRTNSREYRALKQSKLRIFKRNCIKKLEDTFIKDKSNIWKTLKKLAGSDSNINTPHGETLFQHFKNQSHPEKNILFDYKYEMEAIAYLTNGPSIPMVLNSDEYDILNKNFTVDEVTVAIDYLKNNKSAGIDSIPAEFLKATKINISQDLADLFNYIIETRNFPVDWAVGLRSAIHKSGSKFDTRNYRGITVLPMFEKIFEIIVQKRLEFIDEAFNKHDRYNGGFKKCSRTTDNIFILKGLIERQLALGKKVIVCYVDFSKAFDRVNRNILFYKINKSGLTGRVIDTLRNLYGKTSYRLKHSGKLSDIIDENIGVNQGGNTSPLLFCKYLSDLKDYLDAYTGICASDEIIDHMLWADDLFLVACQPKHSQIQLNGLYKFCAPNQMIANEIKTKYMVFGNHDEFELLLNGKVLERVDKYKCLGNIINTTKTSRGNIFRENTDFLCNRARRSVFSIINKVKKIGAVSPKCMFKLYETLVQPVLLYGSDVWGACRQTTTALDKTLYWFLRMVLRVKGSTSIQMLLGETGVLPPSILCHKNVILFYIRLNSLPAGSVLKSVFSEIKRLSSVGINSNNWCTQVCGLALSYNLDIEHMEYNKSTINLIKYSIRNKFIGDWKIKLTHLTQHPILRTYSLFKTNFECESYLENIKYYKYRIALTKFRTSSHMLEIERGRHTNPITPVNLRLCHICKVVEDEYHFLMECSIYDNDRLRLMTNIANKFPPFIDLSMYHKFVFLLSFNDPQIHTWVAKFIYNSFSLRSTLTNS